MRPGQQFPKSTWEEKYVPLWPPRCVLFISDIRRVAESTPPIPDSPTKTPASEDKLKGSTLPAPVTHVGNKQKNVS